MKGYGQVLTIWIGGGMFGKASCTFLSYVIVGILLLVGTMSLSHLKKGAIERQNQRRAEVTRVENELRDRLNKAIPHRQGSEVDKDDFRLNAFADLSKSGAKVQLYEPTTAMFCQGWVEFVDGPNGGHFDKLIITRCTKGGWPPPRVYVAGVLQK
ncbi:MAG: hypothetical protein WCW47_01345 [Candidatus Paceibacterota bacterium]|jgi:hypothetical protein